MSFFAKWFGKSGKKAGSVPAEQHSTFAASLRSVHHESLAANSPLVASRSSNTPAPEGAAPRPGERSARREMVYSSVRESMVRSGILSSGYKFKVLALDKRATQFIVMIDLGEQFCAAPDKLAQIEALIAYSAKSRFEILVSSVYWRLNGQLTTVAKAKTDGATRSLGAPASSRLPPLPAPSTPGIDPVEEAEIEAFKRALLDAAARPVPALDGGAVAQPPASVPPRPAPIVPSRSAAKNTQTARDAARQGGVPAPTSDTNFGGLSSTQYGDLN